MTVTFNEVNNILKTLPIGYYIGRKVEVLLTETSSTSFYNPIEDRIEISFSQICIALSKITEADDIEEMIRSLLYHEVSHAFLTPMTLSVTRIINIFEDERIETLLSSYYMNTNFKKLVSLINDLKAPSTAEEFFYDIVRFRKGPKEFVDQVQEIIVRFKTMNRTSGSSWSDHSVSEYSSAVNEFFKDVKRYWLDNYEELKSLEESTTCESNDDSSTIDDSVSSETTEDIDDSSSSMSIPEHGSETSVLSDSEIKSLFSNPLDNTAFGSDIKAILQKIKTFESRNGSAIHSYSGIFNPRSVARDDYRYFLQENRLGSAKAFAKFHLNLFIDNSASFSSSDPIINMLLKALRDFEKSNSNFSFDLVTINTRIVVKDHSDLTFKSWGGNKLDSSIFRIYNSLQHPDKRNFNIVLFDGDAVSDSRSIYADAANFKAFDHNNTVIISDSDNEWILDRHVKSARKKIISSGYARELQKEILTALRTIV